MWPTESFLNGGTPANSPLQSDGRVGRCAPAPARRSTPVSLERLPVTQKARSAALLAAVVGGYGKGVGILVAHSPWWPGRGHEPIGASVVVSFVGAAIVLGLSVAAVSLVPTLLRRRPIEPQRLVVRLAVGLTFGGLVVLWAIPKII